ncbi:MAG: HAD hydrolase-like protein [Candidatus Micrarchaeia archaeon]
MVKNILFDIDDTLFPSTEFSALARRNALNAMLGMGLRSDFAALSRLLDSIIRREGSNHPGHFDDLCRELKIKEPARYVAAAVAAYHDTKATIAPFPTAPLTLLRLREEGRRLYVATSGSAVKQWDKLIRLGIALYFEEVFVTEELGEEKGERFYRKIAHTLKAGPRDCMMVGDREDADIVPSRAVGMRTVRMLAGKYADIPTSADYAIKDVSEILQILQDL